MLEGLKELKNWFVGIGTPWMATEEDDYRKLEYSVGRHLNTPQYPSPLTYEEEARNKIVKFH